MLQECPRESRAALTWIQVAAGAEVDVATTVAGAVVGHLMMIDVPKIAFDRVHIPRVDWQLVDRNWIFQGPSSSPYELRAVGRPVVPDDEQCLAGRGTRSSKELDDLRAFGRADEQAKIEAPVAQVGHHRVLVPAKAVLQDGSLAPRAPCFCATMSFGQTRFDDEDNYLTLLRSGFLAQAASWFAMPEPLASRIPVPRRPPVRAIARPRRRPSWQRTSP